MTLVVHEQTSVGSVYDQITRILPLVEHASRYIGGEWGMARNTGDASYRVCMCYPDVYDVGVPNQGLAILYRIINEIEDASCERSFVPWVDMSKLMRERKIPLYSLETFAPLASFDAVAITIPHELAYSNILELLDLAQIPLWSAERKESDPIILGGGPSAYNPEPLAPFYDAICMGEGEDQIVEVVTCLRDAKNRGLSRSDQLKQLSKIKGVYVPALYEVSACEASPGYLSTLRVLPQSDEVPARISRRVIKEFHETNPLSKAVVPFTDIIHDRLSVEVLRGCARACRFCQAGMIYRPVRERDEDQVVEAVVTGLQLTGYDEVSLTSLSTTDHSQLKRILTRLGRRYEHSDISISIPSQRLDSFGVEMALLVAGSKKGGLTFAPEAGSQRMRDVINKNVTEQHLIDAVRAAFSQGWLRCKLYFMMGLPFETDEDILAIADLAIKAYKTAVDQVDKGRRSAVKIGVSVSVFVPKAHTPFEVDPQIRKEVIEHRQQILLNALKGHRNISLAMHDSSGSYLEAVMSRGDRRLAPVIAEAHRRGARFDAWTEHFSLQTWIDAAQACGVSFDDFAYLPFETDAYLPWDHIDSGISRSYLRKERKRAAACQTTGDCTFERCKACGICPDMGVSNVVMGGYRV